MTKSISTSKPVTHALLFLPSFPRPNDLPSLACPPQPPNLHNLKTDKRKPLALAYQTHQTPTTPHTHTHKSLPNEFHGAFFLGPYSHLDSQQIPWYRWRWPASPTSTPLRMTNDDDDASHSIPKETNAPPAPLEPSGDQQFVNLTQLELPNGHLKRAGEPL